MNLPINEEVPVAVPVITKTDVKFSVSIAIKEIFIMVGVFNTIYTLIILPNYEYLVENVNFGSVLFMILIGIVCMILLYAPISQLLSKNRVISIYGAQTISDASMLNNIIATFENKPIGDWWDRIIHNFKNPSWASDIVPIYNAIVMTFYDTTRIITIKLDNISNDLASLNLTVGTLCSNQIVFEKNLDELKASQDELRHEMKSGFEEIKMLLRSNQESAPYVVM